MVGLAGQGAWAQSSATDQVVQQLQGQGYQRITIGRTFLGRTRIEAEGPGISREIILNGRTGEVLRDYAERDDDENDDDAREDRFADEDDRDDDRNDDDDDDDDDRNDDRDDDDDDDDDNDDDDSDDDDDDDDDN